VNAEGTNGGGDAMQGLYAERQTERYIPPPVIDVCLSVHLSSPRGR
jgi:hypothetical protein